MKVIKNLYKNIKGARELCPAAKECYINDINN